MKKVMLSLLSAFLFFGTMNAQVYAGHRENGIQVIDISTEQIQSVIQPMMSEFSEVEVVDAFISDNIEIPDYLPSLIVSVKFKKNGDLNNFYKITFQYYLEYDALINKYIDKNQDDVGQVEGGKKRYCVAQNCTGCASLRDEKGRLIDCTPCSPIDPTTKNYRCGPNDKDNAGTADILTGIASIIAAIGDLIP